MHAFALSSVIRIETYDLRRKQMKQLKLVLLMLLLTLASSSNAQDKKWEHSINVGIGVALDNVKQLTSDLGTAFALKAGYGLNYYLTDQWSMQTGLVIRETATYGFTTTNLDVPIVVQYHFPSDNSGHWIIGLGPVFSYCLKNDEYNLDRTLVDALVGQKMFKDFSLGLQPSVAYQLSPHWRIGVEGYIGLTNVRRSYNELSASEHIHSILASVGYVF